MAHVLVNGPASWNTLVRLPVLPEPRSQTIFAQSSDDGLGGTSAGKAVTLTALGIDVTLRTVLGDDAEARLVLDALEHPRLTLDALAANGRRTERHINLMADDGGRVSIYLELPTPVPGPLPSLDGFDAAVLDLADHSRPLLAAARAAGVPIWCDVHDDDGVSAYPRDFAGAADVLLVSAVRLDDRRAYLTDAVARGCGLAICTDGAAGALALDADGWIEVGTAPATRPGHQRRRRRVPGRPARSSPRRPADDGIARPRGRDRCTSRRYPLPRRPARHPVRGRPGRAPGRGPKGMTPQPPETLSSASCSAAANSGESSRESSHPYGSSGRLGEPARPR